MGFALYAHKSPSPVAASSRLPLAFDARANQFCPDASVRTELLLQLVPLSEDTQMSLFATKAARLVPVESEAQATKSRPPAGVPLVLLTKVAPESLEVQTSPCSAAIKCVPSALEPVENHGRPCALVPAVRFTSVAPLSAEVHKSSFEPSTAKIFRPVVSEETLTHYRPAPALPAVRFTQVAPESLEVQKSTATATKLVPVESEASERQEFPAAAPVWVRLTLAPASKLFPDASNATAYQFMRAAPVPSEASSQVEKSPSAPWSVVPESAMLKPLALSEMSSTSSPTGKPVCGILIATDEEPLMK